MSDNSAGMAYCITLIDRLTRVQEGALNKSISLHNALEFIKFATMLRQKTALTVPWQIWIPHLSKELVVGTSKVLGM